jgi:hypothetical protein
MNRLIIMLNQFFMGRYRKDLKGQVETPIGLFPKPTVSMEKPKRMRSISPDDMIIDDSPSIFDQPVYPDIVYLFTDANDDGDIIDFGGGTGDGGGATGSWD